jgi:uncharacterized protein YecE (DUF72 family)
MFAETLRRIGTAGWNIPRAHRDRFPADGSQLARYAARLNAAEINTSFYRPHAAGTYERWAAVVPVGFRFAVKVPRLITHERALAAAREPLRRFLDETAGLGAKRGPLLVQLPPSLAFDSRVAGRFFDLFRASYQGLVVCEPRHPSWFEPSAERLMAQHHVARVAADPAPVAGAERQGGWPGLVYFRLHGSPRRYWSSYDSGYLARLEQQLRAVPAPGEAWCVFDNTASGAALENALALQALLDGDGRGVSRA